MLTAKRKRIILRGVEPAAMLAYFGYRLISGDLLRHHDFPERPRRILVVRLDTIGDVLLSEPAIAALRRRFPGAEIDLVAGTAGRAILAGNPHISHFVLYNAPWHAAWRGSRVNWRAALSELLRVIRLLRQRRYDLAYEPRGDFRDIAFMAAARSRVNVGNGWRGGGFMLHRNVPLDTEAHRVDFALGIVGAMQKERPRLYLSQEDREKATSLLGEVKEAIAFHLGAGFPSKRLPIDTFAEVARRLIRKDSRRQLVVIGGRDEEGLANALAERLPFKPLVLVGKLGLLETAAVLERCRLFIGNDSGPMHMAAAVSTPVVTFFGPSEPNKYHPYGVEHRLLEVDLPCRPCDHIHCVHGEHLCMTRIAAGDIVAAAEELLGSSVALPLKLK